MVQPPPDDIRSLLNSTATGQHLLLGEFVLPFAPGESDPTGVTTAVTDGRTQLWITDGQLRLSIFSRTLGGWTTLGEERIGTIKAFSGPADQIEVGWQLCDGSNDTPDLRDRFILGSDWADIGTVTDTQATAISDHATATTDIPPVGETFAFSDGSGAAMQAADDQHHHNVTLDAHVVSQDYVPPSYKLAWIMKVS
jgi:hypothetical protein